MQMKVPSFQLSNGVEIPAIGLGTWRTPADKTGVSSVAYAIECGYRSIDTAAGYENEQTVGDGIKQSGVSRSELFITTKLKNEEQGYGNTLRAFDESMKKLDISYLDLYLIHWPGKDFFLDTWKAFEKLYEEKLIRAIGVCNFLEHHLETLLKHANVKPMVNQIELHPYLNQKEAEDFSKRNGILIEAWSPLMRGGEALKDGVITGIAEKYAKTPAQVILRWHYQLGRRTLPKSVTKLRIKENLEIFDFVLEEKDIDAISALFVKNQRTGPHPDIFF